MADYSCFMHALHNKINILIWLITFELVLQQNHQIRREDAVKPAVCARLDKKLLNQRVFISSVIWIISMDFVRA